jgi:hypothetical protein
MNTFSTIDDADNLGQAGRVAVSLEGGLPRALGGTLGMRVQARSVDPRFTPFTRLEAPFAGEDWGLAVGGDLEHQQRIEASTWLRPRGAPLTLGSGRRVTAGGFESVRKTAEWSQTAMVSTRAMWERADGRDASRLHAEGGRERVMGELRLRMKWLEPAFHVESDERRSPSDSALAGQRMREAGVDLARGAATGWRASAGYALRRDARLVTSGYQDQNEARTVKLGLESPEGGPFGVSAAFQRRAVTPLADSSTTKSDLASMRLRAESPKRGLKAGLNLELTNEGDNVRVRTLRFVGTGLGGYDQLGNFVGHGDYEMVIVVQPSLETLSRAATSAHAEWQFGASDAWRGSRIELNQESETRRRGDMLPLDPVISPRSALGDGRLARGSVTQRIETELAPGSRAAALRFLAMRQVSADRSDANFAQTLDQRSLSARWRTRPAAAWSSEIEGRWTRSVASQELAGLGGYARTLFEQGASAQLIFTPDAGLRAVAALDAGWSRPEGQIEMTRTVRVGPDLGLAVGLRGRLETSIRRAFISGPAPVSLLPTADPAGAARWQGSSRFDYRVRDSATMGITVNGEERPNVRPLVTGRAELRIFF